ncbi:MAG TPA: hypothetical protein VHD37_00510 [Candidatus Paceibacterota bacterium]|nr:hypothetical protein [Candidatus Paceibacterota bacterium]
MLPKVAALFDEFPFLRKLFEQDNVKSVNVKRWDAGLLRFQSVTWDYDGGRVVVPIYLLDKEGQELLRVGAFPRRPFRLLDPTTWLYRIRREEVGNAVDRVSDADKVYFCVTGFYTYTSSGLQVEVYKPPHGFDNVGTWLRHEKQEAAREFRG